jgi:hypothetical protein
MQEFAGEFLTFLEQREERLLSWGFYNIRQSAQEIEDAFLQEAPLELQQQWAQLLAPGFTMRGFLQQMYQLRLLYLVPGTLDAYRTRFAEGVRLFANLRQMFRVQDWATGPRLVSDIKVHIARRNYPRRDRPAAEVLQKLRRLFPPRKAAFLEQCFLALATKPGGGLFEFAAFQERAFEHIFAKYDEKGISGSVVCAGTGSGKTKAFYIPAFLRVASEISATPFTKIIAVYPRNVLLADQLREAISEAAKLRSVLQTAGLRPICFGALLGPTPWNKWFDPLPTGQRPPPYYWRRKGPGFVIPYLKSPLDGGSDLIWRDIDREAGRTCLYREGQPNPDVPDGTIALTREQLIQNPPDVLFLSLEMLNREMGNPQWQRTFGLRQRDRSPRLVLLDEVHAYEGLPGAQVAWVLRRWRHWAQARALHVVGLSATLRDAAEHLAAVAVVPPGQVREFRPGPGEMKSEAAEYNIALKGDPAAGATLLATSIQAAMLLARLLTPRSQPPSPQNLPIRPDAFYRKKVFAFSDNLDSINRWFSAMQDAEVNLRLARLRLPLNLRQPPPTPPVTAPIQRRMQEEGQIWDLPTLLGHDLNQPLRVTRCSSQDPGADVGSDLIIATSSLEVGFDDPEVAAMLHHKRPTSIASFIQRKGRAGRTVGSRPWTVMVLSDYGADRWAFQSAERLFQPEVESLFLPISNPYVLRVQTALFFVDWLGGKIGLPRSPFNYLAGPGFDPVTRQAQQSAAELLRDMLELGPTWDEFRRDLLRFYIALGPTRDAELASSQLDDIFWYEPRPLLMQAIPSLLRKIEADWRRSGPAGARAEDAGAGRPIPQSIPRTTFSELDVNEAQLALENFRGAQRDPQSIAISRFLFEACPGRVSKRFAIAQGEPGYWHAFSPRLAAGVNVTSVQELFPDPLFLESVGPVPVYQPEFASLVHHPNTVSDTSNSMWEWQVRGRPVGIGNPLPIITQSSWQEVFREAAAFLHAYGSWLEILRYTQACRFEIRTPKLPQPVRGSLELQSKLDDGSLVSEAVGFRLAADGLRFVVRADHLASRPPLTADQATRFRADYFLYRLRRSDVLRPLINSFQADWLAQMSLAMLAATAVRNRTSLQEAQQRLSTGRAAAAARVLDVIFQIRGITPAGQVEDPKLRQTLLGFWSTPAVVDDAILHECVLWEAPDADFEAWARQRYVATLAQALRSAMCAMSDQVAEEELAVDVLSAGTGDDIQIIVTEESAGGLGQIEAITREIKRNPSRFLDAVEFTLSRCPQEAQNSELLAVLDAAIAESSTGGSLTDAFNGVRNAVGYTEQFQARDALRSALRTRGIPARRRLVVSVMMKLLRPGSSPATDALFRALNESWGRHSRRLGLRIPTRTFAYLCASYPPLRRRLRNLIAAIGVGDAPTDPQLYAQIQQMLLEVCRDCCPDCLDQPNRFNDFGKPSRSLARSWLSLAIEEISLDEYADDWIERSRQVLRTRGRVTLLARDPNISSLSQGLFQLINQELDAAGLRYGVTIGQVQRRGSLCRVTLQLKDFVYA